jgi:cytosine/adenosine deaminase-related metal-dependent hydrolase
MFCLCCNPSSSFSASGFFAKGLTDIVPDVASALQRRAAYERRKAYSRAPVIHPAQSEFIVRNVQALTMDADIGALPRADIHVRDGEIANIGRALQASAMLEIDGYRFIALPGLIADHRHPAIDALADEGGCDVAGADAEDIYRIVRLAMLDLMSSGVTSVYHCAHRIDADRAETAMLAHIDSGLRGCFSYSSSAQDKQREVLTELIERWSAEHSDYRLEIRLPPEDSDGIICPAGELIASDLVPKSQEVDLADCTMGAALRLRLDPWVGSLSPGKRADFILVDPNISARGHAVAARALASARDINTANVVLVCIDGRVRKRNGVVVESSEGLIRKEGQQAIAHLRNPAAQLSNGS